MVERAAPDRIGRIFWINMVLAVPQDWGADVPGGFPTNVTNIHVVSPTQLQMTMKQSFASTWFLYNELSQIAPMPAAWDRTASGPSHCDTTVSRTARRSTPTWTLSPRTSPRT